MTHSLTPTRKPEERRGAPRKEMTVLCTTSFRVNDSERRAILLDLSLCGARFGSASAAGTYTFSPDQTIDFDIMTPFGIASVTGKVVWSSSDDVLYTWGVQFTAEPPVDRAPMNVLLAA